MSFHEQEVHNLYVFVRGGAEEYFFMFSYPLLKGMEVAHRQLSHLLQKEATQDHAIRICHPVATLD